MTTGTNGCDTSGSLTYSGKSLLSMNGVLEEVAHDVAMGEGEALTALSVAMGVPAEDRSHFSNVMHQNFAVIFPSEDVTRRASAGEHRIGHEVRRKTVQVLRIRAIRQSALPCAAGHFYLWLCRGHVV